MSRYSRWQTVAEALRRAQSTRGRQQASLYAIEGTRLLERALRAGAPLVAALAAESLAAAPDARHRALLDELAAVGCLLVAAPDAVVEELTEGRDLGRVLALVRLPEARPLAGLLAARDAAPPVFLAAVDIADPGNAGALARTAHAGGATGLLVTGDADPFHPRATRISRGSIFRLPIIAYDTAAALLEDLRRCGVAAVAAVAAGGAPLTAFDWPRGATAVLMGNEAEGLPPDVAAAVDHVVTIPMPPGVDSYSVNAAAAILLYARQNGTRIDAERR